MKTVSSFLLAANIVLLAAIVRLACQGPSPVAVDDQSPPEDDIATDSARSNDGQTEDSGSQQRQQFPSSEAPLRHDGGYPMQWPNPAPVRALDRIVMMPSAFQGDDPALGELALDQRQIAVINELRQKFRDDLADSSQDPADPAYLKRWQEAQRVNDDLLSGLLGGQFFLDYQIQTKGQR